MKISNSKKQLAKIIHENGGWRGDAAFAAQDGYNMVVDFYECTPSRDKEDDFWHLPGRTGIFDTVQAHVLIQNWHQTVLSRDEYFHLYPVTKHTPEPVAEAKPTIEQLAAGYRNRKDYADRKQQEADAAKADAEAKLAELVAAGKALGLVLGVAPVQKYTGKFYNAKLGAPSHYETGQGDEICEGCGRRFGNHYDVLCGGDVNA